MCIKHNSERVQRNLSVLGFYLVLMIGAWKEFFNKREVSGSPGSVNTGLLSWAHQGTFQLKRVLPFQAATYTLSSCLSVTYTSNPSVAKIFYYKFLQYRRFFFLAQLNGTAEVPFIGIHVKMILEKCEWNRFEIKTQYVNFERCTFISCLLRQQVGQLFISVIKLSGFLKVSA